MTNSNAINLDEEISLISQKARAAWFELANLSLDERNSLLEAIKQQLIKDKQIVLASNQFDLDNGKEAGLSSAMLDRLTLTESRFQGLITAIDEVKALSDPIGLELEKKTRENGLQISKISVPIGVISLIFESRPNVTIEAAALAIKSGNSIILKGGKEAFETNSALAFCIGQALKSKKISEYIVTLIPFKEREATSVLLQQKDYIDLIIPRGGEGLIEFVAKNSLVPVLKHYKGVCHTFIDKDSDEKKALKISINAKCQRPGVCNAMETLLVHQDVASSFIPKVVSAYHAQNVEVRGCGKTKNLVENIKEATDSDWDEEYLDLIISIKIVENIEEALAHIEKHGSRHSEAIITENQLTATHFLHQADASAVFVNASTRFNDGGQFGLGAEMGISTDKLHARGPVGIRELTTYKYFVLGDGQIRE